MDSESLPVPDSLFDNHCSIFRGLGLFGAPEAVFSAPKVALRSRMGRALKTLGLS